MNRGGGGSGGGRLSGGKRRKRRMHMGRGVLLLRLRVRLELPGKPPGVQLRFFVCLEFAFADLAPFKRFSGSGTPKIGLSASG